MGVFNSTALIGVLVVVFTIVIVWAMIDTAFRWKREGFSAVFQNMAVPLVCGVIAVAAVGGAAVWVMNTAPGLFEQVVPGSQSGGTESDSGEEEPEG